MNPAQRTNMMPTERAIHLAGGALLVLQAVRGRSTLGRLGFAAAGSGLLYCGLTGTRMFPQTNERRLHITRTVMIDRPAEDLYQVWRNFENLPEIMRHLEAVCVLDSQRSLWRAKSPLGGTVEWEAEVTHEIPNRELGWRSLPGSEVESAGIVRFEPSPLGHGTQLQVEMRYSPPGGALGAIVARLLGEEPHRQIEEDLQLFKRRMESASIPTAGALSAGDTPGDHAP